MKVRKLPVTVEAHQYRAGQFPELQAWAKSVSVKLPFMRESANRDYMELDTLEGRMTVSDGDWVIQGVKGEFYGCKPDVFEKTYEVL